MVPLPNFVITLLFSKMRLKRKDFQEIVRLTWAQEVPSSNLGARPKHLACFLQLIESSLHLKLTCGIPAGRRSGFASRLIPKTSPHAEFAKTRIGRSAIQKLLNRGKLSARHLASMGKIQGTLCISGPINLRKCKSVIMHLAQTALHNVSQFAL